MNETDYAVVKKLKETLAGVVTLLDFRVFGSRARGDADEFSDLDIFLEVEELNKAQKDKISDIVWEIGFEHGFVITPLIFTRDEIEHSPLRASPIVRNIMAEGVEI